MVRRGLLALVILFTLGVRLTADAQPLRGVVGGDVVHVVKSGETLFTLAHEHSLGLEHVTDSNRLPMQLEVAPGTIVTLPMRHILPANPPRDGMVLNVPERGIYLFRQGRLADFFPVAIGRLGFLTPRGEFRVIEKIKDPTWTPPAWADTRTPVGPGSTNPLGDRWIGTSASGVGIHGTQSPYSIGMAISHGCLRMYPDQVRRLFELVWVGMSLRIEYETAKIGLDPLTGNIYLATFPDVYSLQDPVAETRKKLREAGLIDRFSAAEVRSLAAGDYRATALVGSDFVVTVDGVRATLATPPLVRGHALWLPLDVVRALGIEPTVDEVEKRLQLAISGDDMRLALREGLPPGVEPRGTGVESGKAVSTAWRWRGHVYVRADDVLAHYEMEYDWRIAAQSLTVSTR